MSLTENSYSEICARVERAIPQELFAHSLRVADSAADLLTRFGLDGADLARFAGILHDIAKPMDFGILLSRAEYFGILVNPAEQKNPWLLHAKVGAEIAREEFGVTCEEVIEAIRWHTVGCAGMGDVALAVYLADIIEPGRSYGGVERVRAAAGISLREGCIEAVKATTAYVMSKNWPVDVSTIEFYNWLLEK